MGLSRVGIFCLLMVSPFLPAGAQSSENFSTLLTQQVKSGKLLPPAHLKDYVTDGKLRLRLQDAVLLALENNSSIRIEETQVEAQKFSLLGAYRPFDPLVQSSANINRYSFSGYSQLQGVGTTSNAALNTLSQTFQASYTQTFVTGTNIFASISTNKTSTNSDFYFLNPYFSSSVNLQFTQPLLRNAGRFPGTAIWPGCGSCERRSPANGNGTPHLEKAPREDLLFRHQSLPPVSPGPGSGPARSARVLLFRVSGVEIAGGIRHASAHP